MGLGKKDKLIKTNYIRTSQTGRQVSGPKKTNFKKKPSYTIQPASNIFRSIQRENYDVLRGNSVSRTQSACKGKSADTINKIKPTRTGSWSILNKINNENESDEILSKSSGKNFTHNFFKQRFQHYLDQNTKLTEVEINTLNAWFYMMEPDDVAQHLARMIRQDNHLTIYTNENNKKMLSIMIQSTTCSLCQTVDDFCVNCNKRTCNFHSPDAEASQQTSQRHCKPCYDKLANKK